VVLPGNPRAGSGHAAGHVDQPAQHGAVAHLQPVVLVFVSMVAVLPGEGGSAPVRATYPAPMRSSSRIRCTHALNERQVQKAWGKFPRCQPVFGSISVGVQQQRAGAGRPLLAQRPGARLATPGISVSAETSRNERIVTFPPCLGPHNHRSRPPEKLRRALEAINGTGWLAHERGRSRVTIQAVAPDATITNSATHVFRIV
jgi:hypothetical protein